MYSGHPPYRIKDSDYENKRRTALIENPYYKMFVLEQYEEIWQDYSNRKSHRDDPTFYTENFKDLINRMLHYDPAKRLDRKGVKDHPWM